MHRSADELHGLPIGHRQVAAEHAPPRRQTLLDRPAARLPERRCRHLGIERRQLWQRLSDRALADRQVRITGTLFLLSRRDADAHAQAQQHEIEQRRDLVIGDRADAVVAAGDRGRRRERIGLAERGVGHRDGEIGDRIRVHDVAEIQDPGYLPAAFDEDVVIIGIVVDGGQGQTGESPAAPRVDRLGEARDERPHGGFLDERRGLAHQGQSTRQVPVEVAMDRRMIEAVEGRVERGHGAAEVFEQIDRMRRQGPQRLSREPRQQPDEVTRTGWRRDLRDQRAVDRRHDPRTQRRATADMRQRGVLRLEQEAIVSAVGDLQDEPLARGGLQQEILIPLARKCEASTSRPYAGGPARRPLPASATA